MGVTGIFLHQTIRDVEVCRFSETTECSNVDDKAADEVNIMAGSGFRETTRNLTLRRTRVANHKLFKVQSFYARNQHADL
jgi:hypothetical protein